MTAVGLGDLYHARAFREETGISFPLLIDEKREAYRVVGLRSGNILDLFRGENFRARNRARAGGHTNRALGRNPLQLGGSFLFAPGDIDIFQHVSRTFGDNATPERLLAAIP